MATRAGGKRMKVLATVVVVLVALLCVLTLVLAHFVMNGKRPTLEEARFIFARVASLPRRAASAISAQAVRIEYESQPVSLPARCKEMHAWQQKRQRGSSVVWPGPCLS